MEILSYRVLAVVGFSLVFYSFGRWLFFDMLGIKLLAEVVAISFLLIWISIRCLVGPIKKPYKSEVYLFFCFILFALGEYLGRSDILGAMEMLVCLFVGVLFSQIRYAEALAIGKTLVVISSLFAFYAILITFFVALGLADAKETFFSYSEIKEGMFLLDSNSFHNLFGMVTSHSSFDYLGFEVWRLTSVTSEPARLSVYFMIPLVISFLLGRNYIVFSVVIILAVMLTNSWSLFAPLFLAFLFYFASKSKILSKYHQVFIAVSLLSVYVVLVLFGESVNTSVIDIRQEAQMGELDDVFRGSSVPKIASILLLIESSIEALPMWISSNVVNGPLPFYLLALGGLLTLPLCLIGFILAKKIADNSSVGLQQFGLCLLLGIWMTAMVFTTAPFFVTPAGLIGILTIIKLYQPMNSL